MYIIALTGGIGCGKSEASKIFASLGIPIIDLDIISHELTRSKNPVMEEVAIAFGKDYVETDGSLNRTKMRQLIFKDPRAREKLNGILHPAIYQEARNQIDKLSDAPYAILAIPLLEHDSIYNSVINRILVIDCEEAIQIDRVKTRSNLNESEIKAIVQSQTPRQTRIAMADDLIENNKNIDNLHQKINKLHQKYIKTCIVSKTIS
jgi:dephospho-CoA kinase